MSKRKGPHNWADVQKFLQRAFGPERVYVSESEGIEAIKITFDLRDPLQFDQMNQVQHAFKDSKLISYTRISEDKQDGIITATEPLQFIIPKQNPDLVLDKFKRFSNQIRGNGQVQQYLNLDITMNNMEELTGRTWVRKVPSAYGGPILAPVGTPVPGEEQREEQEMMLGEAIIPDRPRMQMRNWIEHQRDVERRKGLHPQTSLPSEILENDSNGKHGSRLLKSLNDPKMRDRIRSAFSK